MSADCKLCEWMLESGKVCIVHIKTKHGTLYANYDAEMKNADGNCVDFSSKRSGCPVPVGAVSRET